MEEYLDVVNENDDIIGRDTRSNIHKNGLKHRESSIFIINKDEEMVLKRRGQTVFFPEYLSISASGHVELADSYIFTAQKELKEETGIMANEEDLIFIDKIYTPEIWTSGDKKYINNSFKSCYLYKIKDNDILEIEEGEAKEFKWFKIDELLKLNNNVQDKFLPILYSKEIKNILIKIKELIKN